MNGQQEFNLKSPAFTEFMGELEAALQSVLEEVYSGNFAGGDISAKIAIELQDASEEYPETTDESGAKVKHYYNFKTPQIDHAVTTTLKRRQQIKGTFIDRDTELFLDGDSFKTRKITKAQLTLEDIAGMSLPELVEAKISRVAIRAGAVDSQGEVGKK